MELRWMWNTGMVFLVSAVRATRPLKDIGTDTNGRHFPDYIFKVFFCIPLLYFEQNFIEMCSPWSKTMAKFNDAYMRHPATMIYNT